MYNDLSEQDFREQYGYSEKKQDTFKGLIRRIHAPNKRSLLNAVPVLKWLPRYKIKQYLFNDIVSGLIVGSMQIPQGNFLRCILFVD